jgi:hypothetical protein
MFGGILEEVSITSPFKGARGYCRFGPLLKETDHAGDWATQLLTSRRNPEMVTAYYAGMLALASYCVSHGGEDEYPEGSEQDDLATIDALLLQLCADERQRELLKEQCWHQAQNILSAYEEAVQAVAHQLLKRRTLDGKEIHLLLWGMTGYPESDWRFQVFGITRPQA